MARAAIEGMKKRGQSDLGDKTLLDAFVPAVDEFERLISGGATPGTALRGAAAVARAKTEEIKPWVAKRGRASYTGERSCNTYDAGSVAIAMMAEQLAAVWEPSSTIVREGHPMKKFVNDPKKFVPEMLKGIALANPGTLKYVPEFNLIMRADAPEREQGLDHPGLGLGARAGARDDRRQGHARRRVSRRRLRRAADGLRGRRLEAAELAQGHSAHRQQLQRRSDGVRDGHRDARRRGHHGQDAVRGR